MGSDVDTPSHRNNRANALALGITLEIGEFESPSGVAASLLGVIRIDVAGCCPDSPRAKVRAARPALDSGRDAEG